MVENPSLKFISLGFSKDFNVVIVYHDVNDNQFYHG